MEPEITLDLNDARVVRDKQDRDVLVGMAFGASAVLSLTLTAMLGSRLLNTEKPALVLIILTLIGSIAAYLLAKRDERWYVLCSILNHMGIGLGLFLLLFVTGAAVRPLYLAMSGIPAYAGLCGASLLFRGVDGQARVRTVVIGSVSLGILAIVSIVLAVRTKQELWIGSSVSAVICCATFCGMAWAALKQDRSVYWTMAAVSFAIYVLVALVAIVFLVAAASGSSNSSKRASRSGKSDTAGTSGRFRRRGRIGWYYYPLLGRSRYHTGTRSNPNTDWGGTPTDSYEGYRRSERKKLRTLLIVLSVLFLSVLIVALLTV